MKGLESAIATITKAGFSHIKVELEAQLGRNGSYNSAQPCTPCEGRGFITQLNGQGMPSFNIECTDCHGRGITGNGRSYSFGSESQCQDFISDHISEEARKAINFMYFYNDHSVDSELTFTLPVKHSELILEVIAAWNLLAEKNGNGMNVEGAGMHISVLPTGNYPCRGTLPATKIANFRQEVTKLLPALFVAGASGDFTRLFNFRVPRISNSEKYSAIFTHGDSCLEYRLFETCYQRPEAIFEFIGVIARTLEFYIDPTKKVTTLGKEFPFFEGEGLKGFNRLPEQVEILKKTFAHVKPDNMTIKEFIEKRNVKLSVTECRTANMSKITKIKAAYKEHLKAYEAVRNKPLDEFQQDNITYWKREQPGMPEDWYWERVTGQKASIETEKAYIDQNITHKRPTLSVAV